MKDKEITILGAGLVGSLMALLLRNDGFDVKVYERRPDMRNQDISAGRSINLALSHRGWRALEKAGIRKQIEEIAIPMYARCIHDEDGSTHQQKYSKNNEAIFSVSRGILNKTLMDEAEKAGVEFFFDFKSKRVDVEKNIITIEHRGQNEKVHADFLIGADGAFSSLRTAYMMRDRTDYQQFYLEHGYKELHIDDIDGQWQIDKNCLHIWPRKNFMLIALPNLDGSFTVTLFLPFVGDKSFAELDTDERITRFFQQEFPDAYPILHELLDTFHENPVSSLITVKTKPWGYADKNLIIGDAAHAIVPFYGQGMNAGFEDCSVLIELIEKNTDWASTIQAYQSARKDNGDAIADLAIRNFVEMRDWVAEPEFLERKEIEKELGRLYPEIFNSVYEMVSFSHVDYSYALRCTLLQDNLLDQIMRLGDFHESMSDPQKKAQIDEYLQAYKTASQQ